MMFLLIAITTTTTTALPPTMPPYIEPPAEGNPTDSVTDRTTKPGSEGNVICLTIYLILNSKIID